jgi:outer membrane protein assembly factor BamE
MRNSLKFCFIIFFTLGLVACYHPDIQQGNDYSLSNIQKLKLGMSKEAVTNVMGQPLLTNIFTQDQITYVYYNYPNRGATTQKHITLAFKNNRLTSIQRTDS